MKRCSLYIILRVNLFSVVGTFSSVVSSWMTWIWSWSWRGTMSVIVSSAMCHRAWSRARTWSWTAWRAWSWSTWRSSSSVVSAAAAASSGTFMAESLFMTGSSAFETFYVVSFPPCKSIFLNNFFTLIFLALCIHLP